MSARSTFLLAVLKPSRALSAYSYLSIGIFTNNFVAVIEVRGSLKDYGVHDMIEVGTKVLT